MMDETSFLTRQVRSQRDVIKFYDDYANSWDQRFGSAPSTVHFLDKRWDSVRQLLPANTQKLSALELGVGTGVYIDRASRLFSHITAVDGSEKMLQELQKKLRTENITNVTTLCSDVVALKDVSDASVDVVYFFGLVEHIIEVDAFFATILRVLKPGGMLIGATPNRKSPWYAIRRYIRGTGKHCESDRYYGLEDARRWVKEYGFASYDYRYWGCVPAGIGGVIYHSLKLLERPLEFSPLRSFCGGITFKMIKP